jgi:hypothetical protein
MNPAASCWENYVINYLHSTAELFIPLRAFDNTHVLGSFFDFNTQVRIPSRRPSRLKDNSRSISCKKSDCMDTTVAV